MEHLANGKSIAFKSFAKGLERPPDIGIDKWSDEKRILPSEGSSESGKWRTSRTPFAKRIMKVVSLNHPAKSVVFMASAQVCKTEIGLNLTLNVMDTQKCPMIAVRPNDGLAEIWSKQKLQTAMSYIPSIVDKQKKGSKNQDTIKIKTWPGGILKIVGAESPTGLRDMSARVFYGDEVDAWPFDVGGEGCPLELSRQRIKTFYNSKEYLASTPTNKKTSRIYKEFLQGSQEYYHVPCPHCQHKQVLKFENLNWTVGQPETARYYCESCGVGIEEHHKSWMLELGDWVAKFPERVEKLSFTINALYAPIGLGDSWAKILETWEKIKNDVLKVKAFTNTVLGWVTDDPTESLDEEELMTRREDYKLRTIPKGVCVLTAGVDVQANRLAVHIIGHARGNKIYIIDYIEIMGDPTHGKVWEELEKYLAEPILNAAGLPLKVRLTAVDTGYLFDDVINFVRPRINKGFIAIKGASTAKKGILSTRPSKTDFTWNGKAIKNGAEFWLVGTDTAKELIFARISSDREEDVLKPESERLFHFSSDLDLEYFKMLTAEAYNSIKMKWEKLRARNETLDTLVYAIAASRSPLVRVHLWTDKRWDEEEAKLTSEQYSLLETEQPIVVEKPIDPPLPYEQPRPAQAMPPPKPAQHWKPSRQNFATRW